MIRDGDATVYASKHPCEYCGAMLDDDGQEESNIAAAGPMVTHFAATCRERVFSALRYYQRENTDLRRQVAELEKDRDSAVDAIDIMMRRHDDELHAAHANGRAERDAELSRSQCNPCGSDFIIGANASPRRT